MDIQAELRKHGWSMLLNSPHLEIWEAPLQLAIMALFGEMVTFVRRNSADVVRMRQAELTPETLRAVIKQISREEFRKLRRVYP